MRELVRRGAAVLPNLITHLQDDRETGLKIIQGGHLGVMGHADEYHARHDDPKRWPPGVTSGMELFAGWSKHVDEYVVKVGDLCYVAVGQIVNRQLRAIRYQPTGCWVVNSPVATPSLAAAVKHDWSGVTAEEHKQSLMRLGTGDWWIADSGAVKRLCFYYPRDGEEFVARLLRRPLYDDNALFFFVWDRLVKEKQPEKWKLLVDDFVEENGDAAAEALPFHLHRMFGIDDYRDVRILYGKVAEFREDKAVAERILANLYPSYVHVPPFINAATRGEQSAIIDSLASFSSDVIDAAAHQTFLQAAPAGLERSTATSCPKRLGGKGSDDGN